MFFRPGDVLNRLASVALRITVFLTVSCLGHSQAQASNIAVIHKGSHLDFWELMHQGVKRGERESRQSVNWIGAEYVDNATSQARKMRDAFEKGAKVILLIPANGKTLRPVVKEITDKGAKVIVLDSALEGQDFSSFVGSDNLKGGREAARKLAKKLNGKGKVALIRTVEDSKSTDKRAKGFRMELSKNFPNIEIAADMYTGGLAESTYRKVRDLVSETGDLDGIFAVNESSTVGTIKALKEKGLGQTIRTVGYDYSPEIDAAIRSNLLSGVIIQDPMSMGYIGIRQALALINNEKIPPVTYTKTTWVNKLNLDSPSIQTMIRPNIVGKKAKKVPRG